MFAVDAAWGINSGGLRNWRLGIGHDNALLRVKQRYPLFMGVAFATVKCPQVNSPDFVWSPLEASGKHRECDGKLGVHGRAPGGYNAWGLYTMPVPGGPIAPAYAAMPFTSGPIEAMTP